MRTTTRMTLLALGALATLVACGGTDLSSLGQEVAEVSCPAGEVAWDFGRFPNGRSSDELSRLANTVVDGGTDAVPNTIVVDSVRCDPADAVYDATLWQDALGHAKVACDGKSSCGPYGTVDYYGVGCKISYEGREAGTRALIKYRCSAEDGVLHEGPIYAVACGSYQAWSDKTVCVPENCYGHTSRNAAMACVADLLKPEESSVQGMDVEFDTIERTLLDPSQPDGTALSAQPDGPARITLDEDQLYRFKGRLISTGTAPRQLLTLWVQTRIPEPKSELPTLDAYRCMIGRMDLSKYTPFVNDQGLQEVDFDETYRIPPECSDGTPFQAVVKEAWRLAGYDLSAAGGIDPPTSSTENHLRASYDLEGKSLLLQQPGDAAENTCNTKPVDFFYNHTARVHDRLGFYSQNRLALKLSRYAALGNTVFNAQPKTLIHADALSVRGLEFKVNKAGRARGDIPVDLTLKLSGPEARQWAMFYQWHRDTTYDWHADGKWYGGTEYPDSPWMQLEPLTAFGVSGSALIPVPDPTQLDTSGQVIADTSGAIPLPGPLLKLKIPKDLSETGTAVAMNLHVDSTFRSALFNPSQKYPLAPGRTQSYVIQICTEASPHSFETARHWDNRRNRDGTLYRDYGDPYTVEVAPSYGGYWQPTAPLQSARNRCVRSGVFNLKGENIVVPLAETDLGDGDTSELNPTTSGEPRMSATFDSDMDRECEGANCVTTVSQGLGGSDNPIKTMFQAASEEESDGTSDQTSTTVTLLGFDVLEAVQDGSVGEVETALTITPNYQGIAKALDKKFPSVEVEAGRITASVSGLSVGLEFKVPIRYGPIQGEVVFGVGAGAGVGFQLKHTYNPHVENSCVVVGSDGQPSVSHTCPDAATLLPAMPFVAARDACTFIGGRLAEPRSDDEVSNMRSLFAAGTEVWVGAQVGNEYRENTDCGANWNTVYCLAGHKTYMRWLSDAENFQVSESFGPFSTIGEPGTLQGNVVSAGTIGAGRPVASAVTLTDDTFKIHPMTDAYPSVCVRPLVTSGVSHEASFVTNVGFSAGFSVAFCTPSSDFGVCLEGSVNVIEATLSPTLSYRHATLMDNAGRSATNSSIDERIDWSVSILTGSVDVKAVSPFGDIGYTLFSFGGFNVGEGTLLDNETVMRKEFQ